MSPAKSIDYSQLTTLKPKSGIQNLIVATLVMVIFGTIILSLLSDYFLVFVSVIMPLIAVGTFIGFFVVLSKVNSKNHERQELTRAFAEANSFTYLANGIDTGNKIGSLFEHGHSKQFRDVISGNYLGLPFELFNYQYTVGSGKNRTTYDTRVMEFRLPKMMPHMVIDSLVEQDSLQRSTLPIEFDGSQRITLEGDFSQYFHLYAPDKYGVTALTILAPDAMLTLLKFAALCDMEIKDNKLYFYWPGKADTVKEYETVFETTTAVLNEIGEKLTKSDVFASASQQASVHSQPGRGVRLEKSFWAKYSTLISVIGFGAFYLLQLAGNSSYIGIAYSLVFVVPLAYAVYNLTKRSRLKKTLAERYQR